MLMTEITTLITAITGNVVGAFQGLLPLFEETIPQFFLGVAMVGAIIGLATRFVRVK